MAGCCSRASEVLGAHRPAPHSAISADCPWRDKGLREPPPSASYPTPSRQLCDVSKKLLSLQTTANIFSFCSPLNPAFLYSLSETAISPTPPPHRCPQEKAISISKQISDGRTHILNPVSCLLGNHCRVNDSFTWAEEVLRLCSLREGFGSVLDGCLPCRASTCGRPPKLAFLIRELSLHAVILKLPRAAGERRE